MRDPVSRESHEGKESAGGRDTQRRPIQEPRRRSSGMDSRQRWRKPAVALPGVRGGGGAVPGPVARLRVRGHGGGRNLRRRHDGAFGPGSADRQRLLRPHAGGRERARHRTPLEHDVAGGKRPIRPRWNRGLRAERGGSRALGSQGQGARPARLRAARRPGARSDPLLRHRLRHRLVPGARIRGDQAPHRARRR